MRPYSAAEAITPAVERTKQFLFKPFRLGRFFKLTLVAALTEGGLSSCNFNSRLPVGKTGGMPGPMHMPHLPHIPWPGVAAAIGIAIAALAIIIPIWLLIAYLVIRLRFSYFDCVLSLEDKIGPAWARFHRQAMRYLGMSICIGLAFLALVAVAGYALYAHFKPLFDTIGSDHPPNFFDFLPFIAAVIPLALLLAFGGGLVNGIASYFILPRMALEDASISEAIGDVWGDVQFEPWQFLLFFLLRFLVTLVASIAGLIVLFVPLVAVVLLGVAIGLLLKLASPALAIAFAIPAGILVGAAFLFALIGLGGTIGTFRRNYALLFYGGRYPLLGNVLVPALPPWQGAPAYPAPVIPADPGPIA